MKKTTNVPRLPREKRKGFFSPFYVEQEFVVVQGSNFSRLHEKDLDTLERRRRRRKKFRV